MLHLLLAFFQQPPSSQVLIPTSEKPSFVLEAILILLILFFQVRLFFKTRSRINNFRQALPEVDKFSINRVFVYDSVLKDTPPQAVLQDLSKLEVPAEYLDSSKPHTKLTILQSTETTEPLERIQESVNTYLIRNKGAVADFNLLRDITQRNLDTLEEEITIILPIPLYVGLLGTMLGIVIGLFNMPALEISQFTSGEGSNNLSGVNVLIDGVKYAMLASFAGLLATVLNSWRFRGAKLVLEHRKHDFFTFLQTELLPILTESVNAGIYDLNRSLNAFGNRFTQVANQLDQTVTRNYDALMAQQELLTKIQNMDLARVATFNIKVMDELRRSTSSLERFGTFLSTLTTLTDNARALVEQTNNVGHLSEQLTQLLTESQRLQRFLMSHFEQLEERGQVINTAVVKLDGIVDKSLDELQRHIVERVDSVRKITIHEDELLLQTFERNRDVLRNLKHLEPLEKGVEALGKQGDQFQQKNQAVLADMLRALEQINDRLAKQSTQEGVAGQFFRWLNTRREPRRKAPVAVTRQSAPKSAAKGAQESSPPIIITNPPVLEQAVTAPESPSPTIIYFAYFDQPNADGWFDDSKRAVTPTASTCYRFTLTAKSSNSATFSVEANPERMPRILNFRDRFLEPACESQNNYQLGHSQIVTLQEGKARLDSGRWLIDTKAKIQYA